MSGFEVIIIGGGPGGLSCATILAASGVKVLVLERKKQIGRKVCAGGITWEGLIQRIPERLIERTFTEQLIFSNWQKIRLRGKNPIIATVNRESLGQWMTEQAVRAGAQVRTGCSAREINDRSVTCTDDRGNAFTAHFDHLVGADGSASAVRRFLNIPSRRIGVGMNYQVAGRYENMEWHLNTRLFKNGYGWIFPHQESLSIGAYRPQSGIPPVRFKKSLVSWAETRGFNLDNVQPQAELINFDYRGFRFDNKWLIGDAAGLASGLTGEGIYPAIVSGEAVARKIIDPAYPADEIRNLAAKQRLHLKIVDLSGGNTALCTLLMETLLFLLRLRLINFQKQLAM
ncbi:MAG TPA: NAD(P)/FAD-dependent oxidoreductase [Desulfobacteraceae bacterium]|nr:NAD(P)/FAD-dependent oxidoreductase [Desulfobacteraceae bacterium]